MKKKILSLLLAISLIFSAFAVLTACGDEQTPTPTPTQQNPEDAVLPAVGPDNTGAVVTELSTTDLSAIMGEINNAYENAPAIDITTLLSDVNLYAALSAEETLSVKDGYITVTNPGRTSVAGFKDGYAITVENGVVTEAEQVISTNTDEEMLANINAMVSAIQALDYFPALEADDLYRSAEWYFFTDAYVKEFIKGAFYTYFTLMQGIELNEEMKAQLDQEIEPMISAFTVKIGFCAEGGNINGILFSVKAADLSKLDMGVSGNANIRIEAKLSSDLTKFNYAKVNADVNTTAETEDGVSITNAKIDFAANCNYAADGAVSATVALDVSVLVDGAKSTVDFNFAGGIDKNGVPTAINVNGSIFTDYFEYYGEYVQVNENVYAYVDSIADQKIEFDVTIDLSKLLTSGKAIDADVSIAVSNARLVVDEIYSNDGEKVTDVTAADVLAILTQEEKNELLDISGASGSVAVELTTENGAGNLNVSMENSGVKQDIAIEVAINSEKATAPSQEIKDLINNYEITEGEVFY